jgi:hypothetical protein
VVKCLHAWRLHMSEQCVGAPYACPSLLDVWKARMMMMHRHIRR